VRQAQDTYLFVLVAVCAATGAASAPLMPELNAAVVNLFLPQFARERPAGVHAVLIRDSAGFDTAGALAVGQGDDRQARHGHPAPGGRRRDPDRREPGTGPGRRPARVGPDRRGH